MNLYVCASLVVMAALVIWWLKKRNSTIRYEIINIEDGWRCGCYGKTPEEAWEVFGGVKFSQEASAIAHHIGFRCVRLRVTNAPENREDQ